MWSSERIAANGAIAILVLIFLYIILNPDPGLETGRRFFSQETVVFNKDLCALGKDAKKLVFRREVTLINAKGERSVSTVVMVKRADGKNDLPMCESDDVRGY